MAKNRRRFLCMDCGVDTGKLGEHYMLNDSVWFSVADSSKGMLCVGCIEKRLGRRLNANDFNNSYVNELGFGQIKSIRLLERLRIALLFGAACTKVAIVPRTDDGRVRFPSAPLMTVDPKEFRNVLADINRANDQAMAALRENYLEIQNMRHYSDEEIQQLAESEPSTIRAAFQILSSLALSSRAEQMMAENGIE